MLFFRPERVSEKFIEQILGTSCRTLAELLPELFPNFFPNCSDTVRFENVKVRVRFGSVRRFSKRHTSSSRSISKEKVSI
jgi:hypothetical protein